METIRHPWPSHHSPSKTTYQYRQPVATMFRRAKTTAIATPPSDGEVRVHKVEKIELVRNLVTKPSIYYGANPMTASTMRRGAAGHGTAANTSKATGASRPGVVSIEDINKRSEAYIRERKRLFQGLK
ncbi:hypothetical protein VPH35_013278 [Triticum aestivum]|uniref:uncharacterized protein n=1 Tax=Triticum aestivum TaxID=4565 RepID=UPI000843DC82|nr:uncharacterized protein LOC123165602 [Triticum aestivum]